VSDVFCYGELGVDNIIHVPHTPTPESAAFPTSDSYRVGGAAANTAVWLSGWGVHAALAGNAIGYDDHGRRLLSWLRDFPSLDLRYLEQQPEVVTPFCRIMVTPDAERAILVYWYPRTPKTPLSREMLGKARFLALDLYGGDERLAAARLAREAGTPTVVVDVVSPDHPVLRFTSIAMNSAAYVRERFPGADVQRHARALQAVSGGIIVTTDGARPVHVLKADGTTFSISPPAVEAVDATGAGDVFRAGLIYGLLRGWSMERSACWATAAGSLSVQRAEKRGVSETTAVEALASTLRPI
jgi:sugar/nucleoside kinase (ribokinase family)